MGCEGLKRQAISALVEHVSKGPLRVAYEPVQLDQGTSSETQAFGTLMRLRMELNPNQTAVKADFRNAFIGIEQRALTREFANDPSLTLVLRYMQSELRP